jgi:hypothetical protein
MARKLGRAPIARLLRVLVYRGDAKAGMFTYTKGPDAPDDRGFRPCEVLAHHPVLQNVRIFQYGHEVDPELDEYTAGTKFDCLAPIISCLPRLEELSIFGCGAESKGGTADLTRIFSLSTLTNLRVLRYYHGYVYPLEELAANSAGHRLTHLLCFPHSYTFDRMKGGLAPAIHQAHIRAVVTSPYLTSLTHLQLRCSNGGDAMIEDVIASGVLKRLKMLDLRHGHVTDAGARMLAACPEAKNLEVLDLINNRLTDAGIAALKASGIPVRADRQQTAPFDDESILYFGDSE